MSLGTREKSHKNDGRTLRMRVAGNTPKRYVEITLNGLDYYDLVLKQVKRINKEPVEVEVWQAQDVDCFTLNETLLRMERECWG